MSPETLSSFVVYSVVSGRPRQDENYAYLHIKGRIETHLQMPLIILIEQA